jgi:hypothetical protein
MEAGGWIENHVAGRKVDAVRAVSIFHHQISAVIFVGKNGSNSPNGRIQRLDCSGGALPGAAKAERLNGEKCRI